MSGPTKHFKRTRIAPTPSGYLHLGNVLSFAVTTAMARKSGAKILLRIDDLDQARSDKQYIQDIFDTLNFLDIPWNEGPRNAEEFEAEYSQIRRMGLYRKALDQLRDKQLVYACTCSRKQLDLDSNCNCFELHLSLETENASWRLITDSAREWKVRNHNGQFIKAKLHTDMQNFVVRKKDGFPAYQLASVIDDLFYNVDLVVRGEDLWPSTVAQHALAFALGQERFAEIGFLHHPLLTENKGAKLSKSAGSASVKYLRESGKSPADIYALIAAMLGNTDVATNWQELSEKVTKNFN